MAKSVKLRQGTATEHEAFTGEMAEVTFDTTNNTIILHDGTTAGGIPMAKLSDVPVDLTDLTDVDDNLTGGIVFTGTTYVVTVASGTNTYSTGNKYYITDLTGASPTVTLTEGETYRFDQSDSTNTPHLLKFSTTADGTHDGGTEYTTGVTYNGVPGQTGAYTEITVEVGAPTLYYYCANHSGMGVAPAPAATESIVTSSLVWHLDAANALSYSGTGTTWADLVGNQDATLVNAPTYSTEGGGSFYFDGNTQYMSTSYNPSIDDWSASAWFKPEEGSSPTWGWIMNSYTSGTSGEWWGLGLDYSSDSSGKGSWQIDNNSYKVDLQSNTTATSDWQMMTGTRQGNTMKLYINGIQVATSTNLNTSTVTPGSSIRIGSQPAPGTQEYFKGYISDLTLYSKMLSQAEVLQNYNALKDRYTAADVGAGPAPAGTPMWSLSGDSQSFVAVSDSKLDTGSASYVALNHPSGRGNTWALEDGSYALRNNPNLVNDPTTRPLHIWSTDDLSDGMTTQYWIKFDANQPPMWEALHSVEAGSSQAHSYSISLAYAVHSLAWAGNGAYGYFGHTSNGSTSFPDQGWLHIAEELQSNGRQVVYINGVVVVNESASDLSGLTNKANLRIGSVSSWITDIEVYTGGGIHNPDLLATPPGFTPPTRKVAPDPVDVADVFNISTYTSSGGARSVVNDLDMATDGGMVWLKSQSAAQEHQIYDTNRGATKSLATGSPNTSEATNSTGLTAFNANGFTIGNHATINTSGNDYVAWSFKKQASFFDIQTWTGDGTNSRSLPHDLNHDVGCIMVKCTSDSASIEDQWWVWHKDLTSNSHNITLSNSTNEELNNVFHASGPSSTHFYVSSASHPFATPPTNGNGKTYVAYLFADNDGDGIFGTNADQDIIKCGVYTGDDTALRTIDIGFEAQFIMTKRINTGGQYDHWKIHDTTRGMTVSGTAATLYPTLFGTEQFFVNANWAQVNSAGWSTGAGGGYENVSGAKYIYIAIKKE
jgi:hypothetical protein